MLKIIISVISIYFMSTTILAGEFTTKIERIGSIDNQFGVMILTEKKAPTKPECATDFDVFSFDRKTEHGRDMYAMALMAFASQKNVIVSYSESSCGLWGIRPIVYRLDVLN